MTSARRGILRTFDWTLFAPALVLTLIGIVTMNTLALAFRFAGRQSVWLVLALLVYLLLASLDMRFIRRTPVVIRALCLRGHPPRAAALLRRMR